MATAQTEVDQLQHLIRCSICLDTLKKPVVLPCIHHFCKPCKSQLKEVKQNRIAGVLCPKCRRFTSHDSIKDDFVMEQIVALHTSKGDDALGGEGYCELCLRVKSTMKCLECKIKMCKTCKDIHLRTPFLRGHRLKNLDEITDEKVLDSVVFCKEHPSKIIEFSCVKCEKAMCYKCKILHHDGHKTETVEDAIGRLMSDVHKKLEPVNSEIKILQRKIKDLEDNDLLTSSWESKTISEINSQKLELMRRIEKDSKVLTEKVRAQAAAKKKELEIQKTDAEHLLSSKESTRSWVNTMVSHLGDVNLLLQLQGDVMTTLTNQQYHNQFTTYVNSAPDEKFSKYKLTNGNIVGVVEKERALNIHFAPVRCDSIDYYDDMGHVEDDYYGTNDDIAYDDDYADDGDVYDPHDDEDYGNNNKYDVDENIMLRPRSPLEPTQARLYVTGMTSTGKKTAPKLNDEAPKQQKSSSRGFYSFPSPAYENQQKQKGNTKQQIIGKRT